MTEHKGLTFYIVLGKYAGFHIEFNLIDEQPVILRLGLGIVAICLLRVDIEVFLNALSEKIAKEERKKKFES